MNGRSYVEISISKLINNLELFRKIVPDRTDIMAVVKADAYGHGDKEVANVLSMQGITHFAVSNLDEAIHLREAGIKDHILILGYTPVNLANELVDYDIEQTLLSEEYADELIEKGLHITCQFAIDTGMKRIGLDATHPKICESIIRRVNQSCLHLSGLFTHLCVADTPTQREFTERQISLFERIVSSTRDLKFKECHCLNSAGGMWYQSSCSDYIRLGIVLYGLKPDYSCRLPEGVVPALTWKSVVSMVKSIEPGDTVGYGRTYTAIDKMIIATIPTGYADGYSRLLSNKGWVLVNGYKARIIGNICMDQMMVDVTGIPNVELGTEVILLGKSGTEVITADDLANLYGTIGYEVICGINKRVDRRYVD